MFSGGGRRLDIKCVHLWNRRRPPAADRPNNNNNSRASSERRSRVTVGSDDDVSVGLRWNSQCIYINSTLSLPFTRHPLQLGGDSGSFLVFVPIEKCFVISHSCPPLVDFSLSRWFFCSSRSFTFTGYLIFLNFMHGVTWNGANKKIRRRKKGASWHAW